MNEEKKSIKVNAALNGFRTILNVLFPLITFPYISHVLSVDEIGKYNFSDSIVSYFLLIAALGINQYAIREGSKYRNNRKALSNFASKVFTVNVVSTIISYALLFILMRLSDTLQAYRYCILILSIQIFFATIGTEWIYSIFEEFGYITVRSIVFKIISIALLFIFVKNEGDYLKYAFIVVFAIAGSNILNYFNAKKYIDLKIVFKFDWKQIIVPVFIIFASNVAIQIYVSSDITMLGYIKSDYNVGIYSVSAKIYTVIKNVLTAVLTVAIPRFSYYAGKGLKDEYNHLLKKVINTLFVIAIPAVVGLILLSYNVVYIIAGEQYVPAQMSLCILCIAIIFAVFNGLLNQSVLLAYGREKISLYCTIISAATNIGLNFIMIPLWAENGAAITVVISELILFLLLFYKSRDLVKSSFFNVSTFKNIMSVLAGILGIILWCKIVENLVTNISARTVISVIGSAILYSFILLLTKNKILIEIISGLKSKLKRNQT